MNHRFKCHGCGAEFPHRIGADLFCSTNCRDQHKAARDIMAAALIEAGFTPSASTPNLYEKDGVPLAIEKVMHEGFREAVRQHATVAADLADRLAAHRAQ